MKIPRTVASYIEARSKIFCYEKMEWENSTLTKLPSGDFIDYKMRIHSKDTHQEFISVSHAEQAIAVAMYETESRALAIVNKLFDGRLPGDYFDFDRAIDVIETELRNGS